MHLKGERWILHDGRNVVITADLSNEWVRVLNDRGMLEVIQENWLKHWLNEKDFKHG